MADQITSAPPDTTTHISDPFVSGASRNRKKGSKRSRRIDADALLNRPWCIDKKNFETLIALFTAPGAGFFDDDDDEDEEEPDKLPYFLTADGIAMIPVDGPLMRQSWWYGTSYSEIQECAAHADQNAAVKAVLFTYNSPGGSASGMFETADFLLGLRGNKPTAAISDDQCYSAAFCLASMASRVFVNKYTGGVGSLGVWCGHTDISGALKNEGVKVTLVFAGQKKVDGNSYEPLPDRVREEMQKECDACREQFVAAVAKARCVSADALMATEAGIYMRADAVPLLADQVGTVDDAMAYLRGQIASREAAPVVPPASEGLPLAANSISSPATTVTVTDRFGSRIISVNHVRGAGIREEDGIFFPFSDPHDPSAQAHVDQLHLAAFAPNAAGWADYEYPEAESTRLFGKPGAVLAVRKFAESNATALPSGRKLSMLVAPYGSMSISLGNFKEVYEKGCFRDGLNSDPRVLIGHQETLILGRQSAGTARFFETNEGLMVEVECPETSYGNDVLISVRRGDLSQSSAAFWINDSRWETRDGERVRVVTKATLRDASVISFPAYEKSTAKVSAEAAPTSNELTQATVQLAAEVVPSHGDFELAGARLRLLRLR